MILIIMIISQHAKNANNIYRVFVYQDIIIHVTIVNHQYQKDNISCLVDHVTLICVTTVKVRNNIFLNKSKNIIIIKI